MNLLKLFGPQIRLCLFTFFCCCDFTVLSKQQQQKQQQQQQQQQTLVTQFCNFFCNVKLFSILSHTARFVTDYIGKKIQT